MLSLLQRHLSASTSSLPKSQPFHAGLCCICSLTVMMLWTLQTCSGTATLAEMQCASALVCVLNVGSPRPQVKLSTARSQYDDRRAANPTAAAGDN